MPDQRMHDLWINSERADCHESCEVHDVRFIDGKSVASSTTTRTPESLLSSGTGRPTCRSDGRPNRVAVEPSRFVENTWARKQQRSSRGEGNASVAGRTHESFSAGTAIACSALREC